VTTDSHSQIQLAVNMMQSMGAFVLWITKAITKNRYARRGWWGGNVLSINVLQRCPNITIDAILLYYASKLNHAGAIFVGSYNQNNLYKRVKQVHSLGPFRGSFI